MLSSDQKRAWRGEQTVKYHEEAEGERRVGDEGAAASERMGDSEPGEAERMRCCRGDGTDPGGLGTHGGPRPGGCGQAR